MVVIIIIKGENMATKNTFGLMLLLIGLAASANAQDYKFLAISDFPQTDKGDAPIMLINGEKLWQSMRGIQISTISSRRRR